MIKSLLYIFAVATAAAAVSNPKFEDADTRQKIVVVDTPIFAGQKDQDYMCKNGTVSSLIGHPSYLSRLEQSTYPDRFQHGENIVGLISARIDKTKYCIYHIAWFHPGEETTFGQVDKGQYINALKMLIALKNVVAVNMSLAGANDRRTYVDLEFKTLELLTKHGIKVLVAAGNENTELTKDNCFTYPACLQRKVSHPENFYVVGGIKIPWSLRRPVSNKSEYLKIDLEEWYNQGEPMMTGTSQATAIFTGKMFSK